MPVASRSWVVTGRRRRGPPVDRAASSTGRRSVRCGAGGRCRRWWGVARVVAGEHDVLAEPQRLEPGAVGGRRQRRRGRGRRCRRWTGRPSSPDLGEDVGEALLGLGAEAGRNSGSVSKSQLTLVLFELFDVLTHDTSRPAGSQEFLMRNSLPLDEVVGPVPRFSPATRPSSGRGPPSALAPRSASPAAMTWASRQWSSCTIDPRCRGSSVAT